MKLINICEFFKIAEICLHKTVLILKANSYLKYFFKKSQELMSYTKTIKFILNDYNGRKQLKLVWFYKLTTLKV